MPVDRFDPLTLSSVCSAFASTVPTNVYRIFPQDRVGLLNVKAMCEMFLRELFSEC